jgi:hypothetical protein
VPRIHTVSHAWAQGQGPGIAVAVRHCQRGIWVLYPAGSIISADVMCGCTDARTGVCLGCDLVGG